MSFRLASSSFFHRALHRWEIGWNANGIRVVAQWLSVSQPWVAGAEITKYHYNATACLLAEAVTSHKIGCGRVEDTKMILASLTQASLVTSSSSRASPFRPWIESDHLRLCTSRSMVWRARPVVTSWILGGSSPTISEWKLFSQWIYHPWSLNWKQIAWVPVVKVWSNSMRGPNPKWPPATILKNRTGQNKVTICLWNYCDTCYTPNLRLINPFLKPF